MSVRTGKASKTISWKVKCKTVISLCQVYSTIICEIWSPRKHPNHLKKMVREVQIERFCELLPKTVTRTCGSGFCPCLQHIKIPDSCVCISVNVSFNFTIPASIWKKKAINETVCHCVCVCLPICDIREESYVRVARLYYTSMYPTSFYTYVLLWH